MSYAVCDVCGDWCHPIRDFIGYGVHKCAACRIVLPSAVAVPAAPVVVVPAVRRVPVVEVPVPVVYPVVYSAYPVRPVDTTWVIKR